MATVDRKQVDGARTQSLFREVNERIEDVTLEFRVTDTEILCECANQACAKPIRLMLDEYEAVRRIPTHFIAASGHIVPEIERVVEERDDHIVVEKFGAGGKTAVRLDPRRRSPDIIDTVLPSAS